MLDVLWHQNALDDLFEIIAFFAQEGHLQAAENFRSRLEQKIIHISKFPETGRPTAREKNLRYILIDKHRRLYYRFSQDRLILLALFDARQNPSKAPF